MTTTTEVTRFIAVKDVVIPVKTLEKAAEECDSYKFTRAGNGHYIVKHDENAYPIIEKMSPDGIPVIGCGCHAWQFAHDNDGCKHIAAFQKRSSKPAAALDKRIAMDLIAAGWKGEHGNLYPPDADANAAKKQEDIDAAMDAKWNQTHPEMTSDPDGNDNEGDDPTPPETEKPEPPLGAKIWMRQCPHCDQRFEGGDLDDVKTRHREHIPACTKNPAKIAADAPAPAKERKLQRTHERKLQEDTKMAEPQIEEETETKMYKHPDGAEFETAEALMDHEAGLQASQDMSDTKALMTPPNTTTREIAASRSWTDEQIDVMKKTVADKATPAEFAYFMNVAAATGLNPFLREIYFMKTDKGQTAIITGRDGYLTIAKRDPRFRGIQSMEVCISDGFEMGFVDGRMDVTQHTITDFKDRGEIIGAWARGQMQGQEPVTVFVSLKEYDKGGNIWNRYKSAMIRKVAESMVLKRIAGISGLVTEAEISESKDMILDAEVV